MNTFIEHYKNYTIHLLQNLANAGKWSGFGILCGLFVGFIASIFAKLILWATSFRLTHTWILFLLPLAGLAIAGLYHLAGEKVNGGTNLVLHNIRHSHGLPARLAPVIFASTVITHLFGGSAGREGAALQMGGSLGSFLAKLLRFKEEDMRRVVMCGMSAAFSALFGTPLAATILPMEISTVGIMYYSALVPCAFASLTAHFVALRMGLSAGPLTYSLTFLKVSPLTLAKVAGFAVLCAVVSAIFSACIEKMEAFNNKRLPNEYLRIFISGCIIIVLTLIEGDQTYNGSGSDVIAAALTNDGAKLVWFAFLLKIVFTVVTLAGGYRGGEIVPSLFIGATLGNAFAYMTGSDPAVYAAMGMGSVFCGITNCPLTALIISFEMFGFGGTTYFLIAISLTFLLSGNYGVYRGQIVRYSKFKPGRIDSHIH